VRNLSSSHIVSIPLYHVLKGCIAEVYRRCPLWDIVDPSIPPACAQFQPASTVPASTTQPWTHSYLPLLSLLRNQANLKAYSSFLARGLCNSIAHALTNPIRAARRDDRGRAGPGARASSSDRLSTLSISDRHAGRYIKPLCCL